MSSSAGVGNIFVYLEDVAPDGKITQVTDARLKASLRKVSKPKYENYGLPYHRSHREDAQPLKPGEPAQLIFAFLPASHIFKAGHRIRISIAGSDYRERDRTPVSPAPIATIHNTPSNPSYISLPMINLKNVRDHKKGED
jgi:predicted acyl esterase